ncbi:hypothetical protein H6G76_30465 [Nostoc sp. FACHB-152]|uniref:hypothetical protein n=1 Tax=unclassified Nostoc TaxID=2593658 RepID=UPI001685F16E|nr:MULTISPECIES: hypothetical protein [unclassified Nostoc]MBD2451373.1 hypothetical protein [Nostoc sp. FACHB-152]MBD2471502.1 hypothetical protein [Nostoc sp. FACHB-145]
MKTKWRKWEREEIDILEEMSEAFTLKQIARRLKKHGYRRTTEGINKKLHRLGYSTRTTLDNYSCNQIAKTLCVDSSTVVAWVKRGWLRGIQRSTTQYQIKSQDLKRFLKKPPSRIKNLIASLDHLAIKTLVG